MIAEFGVIRRSQRNQPRQNRYMSIRDTAAAFFDACETGKGWGGCAQYCHAGATFAAQADALAGVDTLEAYTEWMKNLLTPLPDGVAELKAFAVDEDVSAPVKVGAVEAVRI